MAESIGAAMHATSDSDTAAHLLGVLVPLALELEQRERAERAATWAVGRGLSPPAVVDALLAVGDRAGARRITERHAKTQYAYVQVHMFGALAIAEHMAGNGEEANRWRTAAEKKISRMRPLESEWTLAVLELVLVAARMGDSDVPALLSRQHLSADPETASRVCAAFLDGDAPALALSCAERAGLDAVPFVAEHVWTVPSLDPTVSALIEREGLTPVASQEEILNAAMLKHSTELARMLTSKGAAGAPSEVLAREHYVALLVLAGRMDEAERVLDASPPTCREPPTCADTATMLLDDAGQAACPLRLPAG